MQWRPEKASGVGLKARRELQDEGEEDRGLGFKMDYSLAEDRHVLRFLGL